MTPGFRAAVAVAEQLGLHTEASLLIQETNNTIVWLRPHPVIAKVGTQPHSAEALAREHDVASELAALGAPIAPPLPESRPLRDRESGFVVTLWDRLEHDPNAESSGADIGRSLVLLHDALDDCEVAIPDFRVGLDFARTALFDDVRVAALAPVDREFLRAAYDDLLATLEHRAFPARPLHGEPHGGNVLNTPSGLRWIDFEGTCRGPLEWDLAFLPEEGVRTFEEVDQSLLSLLQTLNSARVATWCAVQARFPEMRTYGEHHLNIVRKRWGSPS
jgi:Ser/Thr protein kinase RdoA (MazF antagonist)